MCVESCLKVVRDDVNRYVCECFCSKNFKREDNGYGNIN